VYIVVVRVIYSPCIEARIAQRNSNTPILLRFPMRFSPAIICGHLKNTLYACPILATSLDSIVSDPWMNALSSHALGLHSNEFYSSVTAAMAIPVFAEDFALLIVHVEVHYPKSYLGRELSLEVYMKYCLLQFLR